MTAGGQLRARLSQAARARVEERYQWDRILEEMVRPAVLESQHRPRPRQKASFSRLLKMAGG